jgi:hypothetical protein
MHRFDPPYYTYVVAARADGRLRIGGWGWLSRMIAKLSWSLLLSSWP